MSQNLEDNHVQKQRMAQFKQYAQMYKNELLNEVIPFWQNGGFFTCLTNQGQIFDTDKFLWLQARQTWMFAMLYNRVQKRQSWLDISISGCDFLLQHGRDKNGDWYFSLNKQGQPLVEPYNIFSDCFAAMALGELYKATKKENLKQIALKTLERILQKKQNPKQCWNKAYKGTRSLKNFALPMILCNLSLILEEIIGKEQVDKIAIPLIQQITTNFVNEEHGIMVQNVTDENQFSNTFQGRLINPGHGNQSVWFLFDLALRFKDKNLIKKCKEILIKNTQFGWDKQNGGIFYFLDIKGYPPQQLQWDQKLWWVHLQSMIAFLKAYKLTGDPVCKEWFLKLHQYTWNKFRDPVFKGQWFGYLNRKGQVLLKLKGGKWKGCFHVPRALYELWKMIEN